MLDYGKLIRCAFQAREFSYSPYSHFRVGAALLCKDGTVYDGCNIENRAYGPTNCAERTAFFKAVSEGRREFEAIAIVGGAEGEEPDWCYPCGVCRQVMVEFCSENFLVLSVKNNEGTEFEEYTLSDLLPFSFGSDNFTE